MAGKIFYRERTKNHQGSRQPRFLLVGVADVDLHIHAKHLRKTELEQIAQALGAELILLERCDASGDDEDDDEVEVEVQE